MVSSFSANPMNRLSLIDSGIPFDVTTLGAEKPSSIVLFSVGGGGNPERHLPLLISLAENGHKVVAPHFERLATSRPTKEELLLRARRLRMALDSAACPQLPVYGVGHSIGATMLLALGGGQIWLDPQQPLAITPDERIRRLVLMAPPTGFFQAPEALVRVRIPLQVWTGTNDSITPPAQAELLKRCLGDLVDLRVVEGAGHFSFMNTLPPQVEDSLPEREVFLERLKIEIRRFLTL